MWPHVDTQFLEVRNRNMSLASRRDTSEFYDGEYFDYSLWAMTSSSLVRRYQLHGGTSYLHVLPIFFHIGNDDIPCALKLQQI